jgi:hypothetical protein
MTSDRQHGNGNSQCKPQIRHRSVGAAADRVELLVREAVAGA